MRRFLPVLLLLLPLPLAACSAAAGAPRAATSADPSAEPSAEPSDDPGTGFDCAPATPGDATGLVTGADVFPSGTDVHVAYERHTFDAARCQSDPSRPADLDADCARPFPFVSAGQAPYAHTLLGVAGARSMTVADVTSGDLTFREYVVSYADAKSATAAFPAAFAKMCGAGVTGGAYRMTGADDNGDRVSSLVATVGANVLVVEFTGAGWADTDLPRVLTVALSKAG
jgi:hypothetical protein